MSEGTVDSQGYIDKLQSAEQQGVPVDWKQATHILASAASITVNSLMEQIAELKGEEDSG